MSSTSAASISQDLLALIPKTFSLNAATLMPIITALLSKTQSFVALDDSVKKQAILLTLEALAKKLPAPENLYVPMLVDSVAPAAIDTLLAAIAKAEADPQSILSQIAKPSKSLPAVMDTLHKHFHA